MNPLFANDDTKKAAKKDTGYAMPNRHGRKIEPLHDDIKPEHTHHTPHMPGVSKSQQHPQVHKKSDMSNPAVDLIRRKLETLYADEPDSQQEQRVAASEWPAMRSKHEQFMYELSTSGKSLAQIQTEWHNYYLGLPDDEKHQVWQEFYAHNGRQGMGHAEPAAKTIAPLVQVPTTPTQTPANPIFEQTTPQMPIEPMQVDPLETATNLVVVAQQPAHKARDSTQTGSAQSKKEALQKAKAAAKRHIAKRVNMSAAQQAKALQHAKSLVFGISTGLLVLLIVLFGLFNEMVIAPFIQPSSKAGATPIILSTDGIAPSSTPEVIIPKINVQIPADYSLTSNAEEEIQKGLEGGIVHYPTTVRPGQKGNAAYFGHSSNNIFNPGKYKFAFVKLHELVPGDIFYLSYEGKVYSYKVYDKQIVKPDQVGVLNTVSEKTATATLITCDPPGTALNRLVVWGEQINPNPDTAVDAEPQETTPEAGTPTQITGNGPSLWKRLTGWIAGE